MVRFCNVFLFVFVHKSYFEFTLTRCEQPLAAIYGANGNWYLLRVPIRRLVGATRRLLGVYSAPTRRLFRRFQKKCTAQAFSL